MHHNLRILMATDSSDQSLNAIQYLGGAFPAERTDVVLFHVLPRAPESFFDLGKDAVSPTSLLPVSAWESQLQKDMEAFMSKAKGVLMNAGFPEQAVTISIRPKNLGVARDILQESQNGYHAVVVGRTGVSNIKDFILGSVVNKLVTRMSPIPLVVVGGTPDPKRVILGFDGSEGANRAVSAITTMLDQENCSVTLCHVIRHLNLNLAGGFMFTPANDYAWVDQAKKDITPLIRAAEKQLVDGGFHPSEIFVQIVDEDTSRARKLVTTAVKGGMGTIVVGRRGLSMVEEFVLGRVSTKVLNMAEDMAVWIV